MARCLNPRTSQGYAGANAAATLGVEDVPRLVVLFWLHASGRTADGAHHRTWSPVLRDESLHQCGTRRRRPRAIRSRWARATAAGDCDLLGRARTTRLGLIARVRDRGWHGVVALAGDDRSGTAFRGSFESKSAGPCPSPQHPGLSASPSPGRRLDCTNPSDRNPARSRGLSGSCAPASEPREGLGRGDKGAD